MSLRDRLFIAAQYLLPHHWLSRLAGHIAECRILWFKTRLIAWFVRRYEVDMRAACVETLDGYEHFNAFFTRRLKPDARPLDETPGGIVSPADGIISQIGSIEHGCLFQAKGHDYPLVQLLGGVPTFAARFQGGRFATIYLSPSDYHRVHMPVSGTLRKMIHVPGKLFSVNPLTVTHVPKLFARNERVICLFDTPYGPMAVILVGAMIVASIETLWAGLVSPVGRTITHWHYDRTRHAPVHLKQGAELGHFRLGSTAIILFGPGYVDWTDARRAGNTIRMGQLLGTARSK